MIKRNLPFIAGLLFGALFTWLAVRNVDLRAAAQHLLAADFRYVVPMVIALALFYRLKAVRWATIVDPENPPPSRQLMPSMMIGFAGNNLLPLRLGELVRVFLGARDLERSKSMVLATLMLERIIDLLTIVVILVCATWLSGTAFPASDKAQWIASVIGLGLVIGVWMVVAPPAWLSSIGQRLSQKLPGTTGETAAKLFRQIQRGFTLARTPKAFVRVLLNSVAQWLLLATCIYLSIEALQIDVAPVAALIVMGLIIVGIALPSAPGFVGTIEYCFVLGLGLFAVDPDLALGAAVFYHLTTFAYVVIVGLYYLRRYNYSWRSLRAEASSGEDSDKS